MDQLQPVAVIAVVVIAFFALRALLQLIKLLAILAVLGAVVFFFVLRPAAVGSASASPSSGACAAASGTATPAQARADQLAAATETAKRTGQAVTLRETVTDADLAALAGTPLNGIGYGMSAALVGAHIDPTGICLAVRLTTPIGAPTVSAKALPAITANELRVTVTQLSIVGVDAPAAVRDRLGTMLHDALLPVAGAQGALRVEAISLADGKATVTLTVLP